MFGLTNDDIKKIKWKQLPPFPHFQIAEARILYDFICSDKIVGTWYFDVKLLSEKAKKLLESENPFMLSQANLYMKRIDAVCINSIAHNIIEVKKKLLSSAIGQLLTYEKLYREQYKPTKSIRLVVVYAFRDEDVEKTCKEYNIKCYWVNYQTTKGVEVVEIV